MVDSPRSPRLEQPGHYILRDCSRNAPRGTRVGGNVDLALAMFGVPLHAVVCNLRLGSNPRYPADLLPLHPAWEGPQGVRYGDDESPLGGVAFDLHLS